MVTLERFRSIYLILALSVGCMEQPASNPSSHEERSIVKVSVMNEEAKLIEVSTPKVERTDAEWNKQLTPNQFAIARMKGTEAPFTGGLLENKHAGVYTCVCCGLPLFSSDTKFNSGTGWPSFFKSIDDHNVVTHNDTSYGMVRSEILCARCDAHLGHVFDDGPQPTGLRYCVNSESLKFTPKEKLSSLADPAAKSTEKSSK